MKEDDFASVIGAVFSFLVPVGVYCFLLAVINRRTTPLLVQGTWDMVGLFFASSGFLFVTAPLLFQQYYIRALADVGGEAFQDIWFRYWLLSLAYYVTVIVIGGVAILWRSDKSAIYNVDPDQFGKRFEQAAASMGMAVESHDSRMILKPAPSSIADGAKMNGETSLSLPRTEDGHAELVVEPFPAMYHVTLHWREATSGIRERFEAELDKSLADAAPVENTASGWFFSISGLVFGSVTMVCIVLALLTFLPRR